MVIAFLVALSIGLRVAWVLMVPTKPVGDFAMYIESATHLIEHGALDDRFVYMPGYVLLIAFVQVLGGGWLAIKICGAVIAGAAALCVHGITARLWNPHAARVATLLYAIWPGAIAVASVTGTDTLAAALMCAALYFLTRWGDRRPWRAAIVFGLTMGLAAYVRAVALPLTVLSVFYFLAVRQGWRHSLLRATLAATIAFAALSPWGLRNRLKYGEWIFTDSHGGLTALVGAYPNSDGHFTRALNRTFKDTTGMTWLEPPHREADRTAYALSRTWKAFDRAYGYGLSIERADRLLSDERSLLYWPLYREGVLQGDRLDFFARWRRQIENIVDGFWWTLVVTGIAGFAIATARRNFSALAPLPFAAGLAGVYVLYFAESRYHLPIAVLLFPSAAGAMVGIFDGARRVVRERVIPVDGRRTVIAALGVPALTLIAWRALVPFGHRLVDRHRFAVHGCWVGNQSRFCLWKRSDSVDAPSPVRGVFDGVGLAIAAGDRNPAVQTTIALPAGRYRITAQLDAGFLSRMAPPTARPGDLGSVHLTTGNQTGAEPPAIPLFQLWTGGPLSLEFPAEISGNPEGLQISLSFERGPVAPPANSHVWLTGLRIVPD